jgi:hypothetical protein
LKCTRIESSRNKKRTKKHCGASNGDFEPTPPTPPNINENSISNNIFQLKSIIKQYLLLK